MNRNPPHRSKRRISVQPDHPSASERNNSFGARISPSDVSQQASYSPYPPATAYYDQVLDLAAALQQTFNPLQRIPKPRRPHTFSGEDPQKLDSFISECELNFDAEPHYFSEDTDKVNFALSYLQDFALLWFEPAIMEDQAEPWMHDWRAFVKVLQENFGPPDPEADAEYRLDELAMTDEEKAIDYTTEFNHWAAKVKWGEAALRFHYHKGLAPRIKDGLLYREKPRDLASYQKMVTLVDAKYWQWQEKLRANNSRRIR